MYHELSFYTLSHGDPAFIHQYIVDAYAAQHAAENVKPIGTVAALIGLYLLVERHYSGREVQRAHMALGNKMKGWPPFSPPREKAALTVVDVVHAPPGEERDRKIQEWAKAVWRTWESEHQRVERTLQPLLSSASRRDS